MRRMLHILVSVALLLSVAFTNPIAGHAQSSAPTDACALLTPAQIQTVLGATMTAGQPLTPTIRTSCKWTEAGVPGMKAKTVIVSIKSTQAYEVGKSLTSGTFKMTPVSGLGDDAYMTSGTISYGATLSVRRNGTAFTVTVRGYPDVPTIEEKDKALAVMVNF